MVTWKIYIALAGVFLLVFMLAFHVYDGLIGRISIKASDPRIKLNFALLAAAFITIAIWVYIISVP